MNEINDLKFSIYQEIEKAPELKFKQLNQKESNLTHIVLKTISQCQDSPEKVLRINKKEVNNLIAHLKAIPADSSGNPNVKKKSHQIIRIAKGILNFLGCRVSSKQLLSEFNKISSEKIEFVKLPALIQSKTDHLNELEELSRFQTDDALPLYQDILNFYRTLPEDLAQAKPLIEEKIKNIKHQLQSARESGKEVAYLHILEKEILESLRKMGQYEEKKIDENILETLKIVKKKNIKSFSSDTIKERLQANFNKELFLTRKAWENAANECDKQKFTQEAIKETKELIASLKLKLEKYNKNPFNHPLDD